MAKLDTIEAYITSLPESSRDNANIVRNAISNVLPGAIAAIKYDMPVFLIDNQPLIYFAVWKKHIGLYPIYKGTEEFERDIAFYRAKTDTVQFALNQPLPVEIIEKIVLSQLTIRRVSKSKAEY